MTERANVRRLLPAFLVALAASLTSAPAHAAFPGANGRIVYDGGHDVFTANPDGSDKRKLTTGGGTFEPTFDAQGQRIAFGRGGFIWVMNADGSGQRNVTGPLNLPGTHATW